MGIYHKLDGNILYNFEVNVDKDINAIRLGYKPLFIDDNENNYTKFKYIEEKLCIRKVWIGDE